MTDRQELFVTEYLKDFCAQDACLRAGYSPKHAAKAGWRLLQIAEVKAAIDLKMATIYRRNEVTAERVIREYARIAFSDMRSFVYWDHEHGAVTRNSVDLSDDDAACVAEVIQVVNDSGSSTFKFKLHDKKGALDALARHLKLDAATERLQVVEGPAERQARIDALLAKRGLSAPVQPDTDEGD